MTRDFRSTWNLCLSNWLCSYVITVVLVYYLQHGLSHGPLGVDILVCRYS